MTRADLELQFESTSTDDAVLTVKLETRYSIGRAGPDSIDAPVGRAVRFHGCTHACCPPADFHVAGGAGMVVARDGQWFVTNESASVTLRVWNLDDPNDQTRVPPGQTLSPPFDLAGISGAARHILTVFGPNPSMSAHGWCIGDLPVAWGLDPASRRHDVMVTLVARRMRGDMIAPPPTAREIGSELGISPRTVQEHLKLLAEQLDLRTTGHGKPGWIQTALTEFAVEHPYLPPPGSPAPW